MMSLVVPGFKHLPQSNHPCPNPDRLDSFSPIEPENPGAEMDSSQTVLQSLGIHKHLMRKTVASSLIMACRAFAPAWAR
jgi:hypothetical protein